MHDGAPVGPEPVDIADELGLTVGTTYYLQYQGAGACYVQRSDESTTPDTTDDATLLASGSQASYYVTIESGVGVWCWTSSPAGGRIVTETG